MALEPVIHRLKRREMEDETRGGREMGNEEGRGGEGSGGGR